VKKVLPWRLSIWTLQATIGHSDALSSTASDGFSSHTLKHRNAGNYHGLSVFVKFLELERVMLTRDDLLELKLVRPACFNYCCFYECTGLTVCLWNLPLILPGGSPYSGMRREIDVADITDCNFVDKYVLCEKLTLFDWRLTLTLLLTIYIPVVPKSSLDLFSLSPNRNLLILKYVIKINQK